MIPTSTAPVVVGIDGSPAALRAAEWAVAEAVSRDAPIRLVDVIQSTSIDVHRETASAEKSLRAAEAAIAATGELVKVEGAIVRGPVAATLVTEAANASMMCLGFAGVGNATAKYVGQTTAAVARSAPCPVAIVRADHGSSSLKPYVVAAVIDDSHDVERVLHAALQEVRLRHASLLVINVLPSRIRELLPEDVDRRVAECLAEQPDVGASIVMAPNDVAAFLARRDPPVHLAVVGRDTGDTVTELAGTYARMVLRESSCSVLVLPG